MTIYDEMTDIELALQYLAVSKTEDRLTHSLHLLCASLLRLKFPDADESQVNTISNTLAAAAPELMDGSARVILKHYTRDEIIELIAIHSSDLMQKALSLSSAIGNDMANAWQVYRKNAVKPLPLGMGI